MKQKRDFNWPFFLSLTIIMIVVLNVPKCAFAGNAELSWTHPTLYEDGTALPIGQIARTEVQYGVCDAAKTGLLATPAPVIVSVLPPPALTTIAGLAPNTWCFRARTVATNAQASAWTPMVWKVVLPSVPKPPSGLTIAADRTAYSVVKRVDRFALIPVGVAAEGTLCISDQQVNGYYVVPRASVVWSGTVRPDVVVALCG